MKMTKENIKVYDAEPTHCRQCGAPMVKGPIKPWVNQYEADGTPTEETQHTLKCQTQTRAWWKRIFDFSYHEEFLVIDHPKETKPYLRKIILQTIKLA